MQPLPTTFEDRTFRYQQVERRDNLAIFTQTHKTGKVVRYEVVRIRISPAHTWPNGDVSPERETYPGSAAWGHDGFTCFTLREAEALLAELASRRAEETDDAPSYDALEQSMKGDVC
jgi:hypothetical protein